MTSPTDEEAEKERKWGRGCAIAVLLVIAIGMAVDILAVTLLGTNANVTFSKIGPVPTGTTRQK